MARAVEHADDDLFGLAALFACHRLDILAHAVVEIDDARRIAGADREFVHIDLGGVQEAAFLGDREHRSAEHPSALQSLMRISYAVSCLGKKHEHTPDPKSLLPITHAVIC